ncbi:MAG: insulinase family protein, partial [Gemmatimonadota bacterium]
ILREEKGWTYGARSRFTEPRDRGYFAASADVRPAVTDSTLAELMDQLRRIRSETVPGDELEDAKSYLTGNFPLQLETPQQVASQVADALLRGLGIEYLETYRSRIAGVTAADVRRAAREHVHPDRATAVVVGDAREVHEDLTAIAPVILWDTDFQRMQLADLEVQRSDVALDASRIRRGTYSYSFRFRGKPLGDLTVTVEETEDGNVRVVQDLSGQITRSSSYVMTPDVSPLSVTNETHMGPMTLRQDLDYEGNRVTGQATVPERGGGGGGQPSTRQISVDTTLAEGTLDSNMDLAAVLGSPLAEGMEVQIPVFAPGQGVNSLRVSVTGRETVQVPAGSYETWAVEVQGPNQTVTLYVTRETPHLMVKQELSGQPITVELTGTGSGEASSGS